jgi:surface polysaccharide O-acyltransferase-like enzyme
MPRATAQSRRAMLDLARLAAAYAILWLHTPQSPELQNSMAIGRFAVPFFVLATVLLVFEGVSRDPQRSWRRYTAARCARLYLPFLAWTGVYLAFKVFKGLLLPGEPNDYPGLDVLWAGGCWHLWFLPFILGVSLMAFAAAKTLAVRPELAPWLCVTAFTAGLVVAISPLSSAPVPASSGFMPAALYRQLVLDAFLAALWGIAIAVACRNVGMRVLEHRVMAIAGALLLVAGTVWVWNFGRDRLVETLAGLGCLMVAFSPRQVTSHFVREIGALAFGIYLAHVLWIKIFQTVATKAGFPLVWQRDVMVFLASAAASTLLVWAMSRSRWTRWMVV